MRKRTKRLALSKETIQRTNDRLSEVAGADTATCYEESWCKCDWSGGGWSCRQIYC